MFCLTYAYQIFDFHHMISASTISKVRLLKIKSAVLLKSFSD